MKTRENDMLTVLRAAGYRLTPQRESVLSVIAASRRHLTAEEILRLVRQRYPYLGKSAVYRSLELLTELQLVTQTDLGQGRIEYEIHQHPHHHHLICEGCGGTRQVDDRPFRSLKRVLRDQYGFEAEMSHFAIFGLCQDCAREKNQN